MFFSAEKKEERVKLLDVDKNYLSLRELKDKYVILVVDDKFFVHEDALRGNGFRILHWRDVEDVNQVAPYPIIACDVNGIGKTMRPGSPNGGLHVLHEIKKHYPDKYLIQYSAERQDFDENLISADKIYPKDTSINTWQKDIEKALEGLGNPKYRWIRLRRRLSDNGVDAYDIYKLEQAYIKELLQGMSGHIEKESEKLSLNPETKKLIMQFCGTVALMGFKEFFS